MKNITANTRRIQASEELVNEYKDTLTVLWRDLPLITFISVMLVVFSKALAG